MERSGRALPYEDLVVLHGVVAVLEGHLVLGELPADLIRHLVRRLTEHGPLPQGSTAGSLTGLLADLSQRLHWAMGVEMDYPAAVTRRTSYRLSVPAGSAAGCVAALRQAGAEEVHEEVAALRQAGAEEVHEEDDAREQTTVTAIFAELAPDPAYQERVAQLSALAARHGGEYQGAGW